MNVSNKSKQFNLPISSTVTNIRQLSDEYETKNKLSQNSSDTSNDQRNGVEETPIPLNNQSQLGNAARDCHFLIVPFLVSNFSFSF